MSVEVTIHNDIDRPFDNQDVYHIVYLTVNGYLTKAGWIERDFIESDFKRGLRKELGISGGDIKIERVVEYSDRAIYEVEKVKPIIGV